MQSCLSPCVLSVQHSGSRSLMQHLGIDVLAHFNWKTCARYAQQPDIARVPVRHPYQVATSWARRGKHVEALIEQYLLMMVFMCTQEVRCIDMRTVPVLAGAGDEISGKADPDLLARYIETVDEWIVQPYASVFEVFYPELHAASWYNENIHAGITH